MRARISGKLLSTVAIQLAATSKRLKQYICEAIAQNDSISRQSMRDQWTKLVYQPLLKLEGDIRSPLILVFVIDALDECGHQQDIQTFQFQESDIVTRVGLHQRPNIVPKISLGVRFVKRDNATCGIAALEENIETNAEECAGRVLVDKRTA